MDKKTEHDVRVIDNVQEVLDLLKERSLKVEARIKAQEALNRIDDKLGVARANLRKHVDSHSGELSVDINSEIFKITAHPDDGNVIIEPVHIDFRRQGKS